MAASNALSNVYQSIVVTALVVLGIAGPVTSASAVVLPNTIANLELWYQADDGPRTAGNPSLPNQIVDTWLDSSVAGNNGAGSITPILRLRNFNSQIFPVVEFSGGGDRFGSSPSITNAAGSTYFVVFSQQGQSNGNGRFIAANNGGANFRNFTTFNNQFNTYDGTSAYNHTFNLQDSNFHIGVLLAQPNSPDIYLDGNLDTLSGTLQGGGPYPAYNIGSLNTLTVGADSGGGQTLLGDIAEVLVYDRPLTSEEHNTVGFYLQDKYGINGTYEAPPVVPEPSTFVLLALSTAGIVLHARRRRRSAG